MVQSDYGANEIIYCGYRFDPETQNYYVRNRTYNSALGRWIQRDPIGYLSGINLYGYVESSPAGLVDANGAAANGLSAQLSYQFLMQRVNKELKKSSEAITKLKQKVMANLIYSDKAAMIELSVSGASPTDPFSLMSVNSLSLKGTYTITHSGGSKTTGTVDSSFGVNGGPPGGSIGFNNTPPTAGGLGYGGGVNWMSAGVSAFFSQEYTALVGGIKTNVSVRENYLANGTGNINPSATLGYTIPGLPITIGGFLNGGNLFGGQANGLYGGSVGYTSGHWSLKADICRSLAGKIAGGGELKFRPFGKNFISVSLGVSENSSPRTMDNMIPGAGIDVVVQIK